MLWLWPEDGRIPGAPDRLPVVGFEMESSWRTRKHVKGDAVNLQDLSPPLGVIVLLGSGPEVVALRTAAQALAARSTTRLAISSDEEIRVLEADARSGEGESVPALKAHRPAAEDRQPNEPAPAAVAPVTTHSGKYQRLWSWLRKQQNQGVGRCTLSFAEIEEVLGFDLPPSCRKHAAHWSSYEGSAVVRAIRDAGWKVEHLDLGNQRVTFVSTAEPQHAN